MTRSLFSLLGIGCMALLPLLTTPISAAGNVLPSRAEISHPMPVLKNHGEIPQHVQELLEQGMASATAAPPYPFMVDRSKCQEDVLFEYVNRGQYLTAFEEAWKIENWRRGNVFAEIAWHIALDGDRENARTLLSLAEEIANSDEDWRKDRLNMRVARVFTILGDDTDAERLEAEEIDESEQGRVHSARSQMISSEIIESHLVELDALASTDVMDIRNHAIDAYLVIFDRFYENESVRQKSESAIMQYTDTLPLYKQFEFIFEVVNICIKNDDQKQAIVYLEKFEPLVGDEIGWEPRHHIELKAKMANAYYRAGNKEKSQELLNSAMAHFDRESEKINNFWRGIALRPIAETHMLTRDQEKAREYYQMALDHADLNPNIVPTFKDLTANTVSMARSGFEPTEAMWKQIRTKHAQLESRN